MAASPSTLHGPLDEPNAAHKTSSGIVSEVIPSLRLTRVEQEMVVPTHHCKGQARKTRFSGVAPFMASPAQ